MDDLLHLSMGKKDSEAAVDLLLCLALRAGSKWVLVGPAWPASLLVVPA